MFIKNKKFIKFYYNIIFININNIFKFNLIIIFFNIKILINDFKNKVIKTYNFYISFNFNIYKKKFILKVF